MEDTTPSHFHFFIQGHTAPLLEQLLAREALGGFVGDQSHHSRAHTRDSGGHHHLCRQRQQRHRSHSRHITISCPSSHYGVCHSNWRHPWQNPPSNKSKNLKHSVRCFYPRQRQTLLRARKKQ